MWLKTLKGGKNWDSPVSWSFCKETNQGLGTHLLIIFRSPSDGPDRPWGCSCVFFVPVEFQSGLEHKGPPALGIHQGMHHLGISDKGNQIIIIPRISFNVLSPLTWICQAWFSYHRPTVPCPQSMSSPSPSGQSQLGISILHPVSNQRQIWMSSSTFISCLFLASQWNSQPGNQILHYEPIRPTVSLHFPGLGQERKWVWLCPGTEVDICKLQQQTFSFPTMWLLQFGVYFGGFW